MKFHRLSALLLSCCCVCGMLTPTFAVETQSSASSVLPYDEAEDPLTDQMSTRSKSASSEDTATSEAFSRVFASIAKTSRYSKFVTDNDGNLKCYQVPSGYQIYDGIDVSKWDGSINWTTVSDEIDFAFIRVGYRGVNNGSLQEDPLYDTYMSGANAAGIPVGIYIYSQALTTSEAVAEANFALERAADYTIELPIVMDYEFYGTSGRLYKAGLTKEQKTANVLAFCETIRAAGYQPMLYADKNFLTNEVNASQIQADDVQIWLANYTTNTTYSDYDCWQYSNKGALDGISSEEVDCNFYLTTGELVPTTYICGFQDVLSSQWYAEAVSFVVEHQLMVGTSSTTFEPNTKLTRAMAAQILYNFAGNPEVSGEAPFSDIAQDQWYTDAVNWVYQNGIMSGYSSQTFGVDDPITRQDLAVVLLNYSQKNGLNVSSRADLSSYTDASAISDYALDAMQWAVASGIISGVSKTQLAPKASTTRAECAQMFKNYLTGPASSLLT